MSGKIFNSSSQWWVMDGKEESLGTDGNSFLGLHSHYVCSGEPPEKAVTFLMAKNTTHTCQENIAPLSFNFDVIFWMYGIVTLEAWILCSWFLSHHNYSDFIYHVIETPTTYLKFEIQKLLKATLEFGNHFDKHHGHKERVDVFGV